MKKVLLFIGLTFLGEVLSAQKNVYQEDFTAAKAKWSLLGNVNKDSSTVAVAKGQLLLDNKQAGLAVSINSITNKKVNINTDEVASIAASFTHIAGQKLAGFGLLLGETLIGGKYNGYCFSTTPKKG